MNPLERTTRILVACEDRAVLQILADILLEEGYDVVCVDDGNEALDILLHEEMDLALLQGRLPHWNGFSVCRIIKSNPSTGSVPVILIPRKDSLEDRIEGWESGADDFVYEPFHKPELLARIRSLLKLKFYAHELENAEEMVFALALSVEGRDPYTQGHCDRLSRYTQALAERLGLAEAERVALRRASVVHDLGKIAIPDDILLKPAPLTPEERRVVERHPAIGEQICSPLKSFRLVLPIIRHHHERMDGSGYPDGLRGEAIPLPARILTVADVFDALTTDRPYRKALLVSQALTVMEEEVRLGWLDGRIVELLSSLARDPASELLKKS